MIFFLNLIYGLLLFYLFIFSEIKDQNFSILAFQDNYVVLLMNLFGINFDFNIFQEWVNKFVS